ncbi:MAG: NUDIX domain-containing protein [Elioraea tepidiphila]
MNARPPKAKPIPAHPGLTVLSDEVVWDGRFPLQRIRFRRERFDGGQGGVQTWELWRRGQAVAVLPWDPWTDRVALIEQFRLPALAAGFAPVMVECPAGLLEDGEDPAEAARRELAEETGLVADRLLPMGRYILNQGGSDENITLFLARTRLPEPGHAGHHGLHAEHEDIRLLVLDADAAIAMLDDNRMCNATGALCLSGFARRRAALLNDWTA